MNIIEASTPYGSVVFCDDIRREESGKYILIGAYGTELILRGQLPVQLPSLALHITYLEAIGESQDPLELVVYMPEDADDKPGHRAPIPPDTLKQFRGATDQDPRPALILQITFSPFALKQEGVMRVRMIRGDDEIRLGALRIRSQPASA